MTPIRYYIGKNEGLRIVLTNKLKLASLALIAIISACHSQPSVRPAAIDTPQKIDSIQNQSHASETTEYCPSKVEAPTTSKQACELIYKGSTPGLYIEGTLLKENATMINGGILIDSEGSISCSGCECRIQAMASDVSRISCANGLISPGLINPHDHLAWSHTSPVELNSQKYTHRNDWRGGKRQLPKLRLPSGGDEINKAFGEIRHIMHATTSIAGSASVAGFARNLDDKSKSEGLTPQAVINYNTFPLENGSDYALKEDDCFYSKQKYLSFLGEEKNLLHLAEGIDQAARNEFLCLSSNDRGGMDVLGTRSTIIHAIALNASDGQALAERGSSVVWSPRSNLALYGNTAPVSQFKNQGINLAIGSDWLPSGSPSLIEELQCASEFNKNYLNDFFSSKDLWRMATLNAAQALKVENEIGRLEVGYKADIAVFKKQNSQDPFETIINSNSKDIVLVIRGGKLLYGDQPLINKIQEQDCEPFQIDVCGELKSICSNGSNSIKEIIELNRESYPLFSCEKNLELPSCTPSRANEYDGFLTATDYDGDGLQNDQDNCPNIFNPIRKFETSQSDIDNDGIGDACDPCPLSKSDICPKANENDRDQDLILDYQDNCPLDYNPNQSDLDNDGVGDTCDLCLAQANPKNTTCEVSNIFELKSRHLSSNQERIRLKANVSLKNVKVTSIDDYGYYLQDSSDENLRGIYVYSPEKRPAQIGSLVQVSGELTSFFGQLQLKEANFKLASEIQTPISYRMLSIYDLKQTSQLIQLESSLIEISESLTITSTEMDPNSLTRKAYTAEGIVVNLDKLNETELFKNDKILLKGILRYYQDEYQVWPQTTDDIEFVSISKPDLVITNDNPSNLYFLELEHPGELTPKLKLELTRALPEGSEINDFAIDIYNPRTDLLATQDVIYPQLAQKGIELFFTPKQASSEIIPLEIRPRFSEKITINIQIIKDPTPQLIDLEFTEIKMKRGEKKTLTLKTNLPASKNSQDTSIFLEANEYLSIASSTPLKAGKMTAEIQVYASKVGNSSIEARLNGSSVNIPIKVVEAGLMISEILYDPIGADDAKEWIEIYNDSNEPIQLDNYTVVYYSQEDQKYFLELTGQIEAYECIIIGNSEETRSRPRSFKPNLFNAGKNGVAIGLAEKKSRSLIDLVLYGKNNDSNLKDLEGKIRDPDINRFPGGWTIFRSATGWQASDKPSPRDCSNLSPIDQI